MHRKRRVLPLAVLVILLAINAALIVLLLRPQGQLTVEPAGQLTTNGTSPTSLVQVTPGPVESSSVSQSSSPSSTATADQKVEVPTRLLVVTSATDAWRATVGDCKTKGRLERSSDGGKSWKQAVKATLGPIMQLEVDSNDDLYTVGGDGKDCSIHYISYAKDGVIAAQTDKPQGVWSRDPKKPDQIRGPGSATATPCSKRVLGLAALDDSEALLVCLDGSVRMTSNSGKSWKKADKLAGTMAVGAGGGRFWVAGQRQDCDGIAVQPFSPTAGSLSPGDSQCVRDLMPKPGEIAIDAKDKAIWLWAGGEIKVSTDRGRSWQAR